MSGTLSRSDGSRQISGLYDDPFDSLERRMNQLFRGVFENRGQEAGTGNYPVDVTENDDQITIEAEMPGFKKDEVEVNVENGVLTIKAERQSKSDDGGSKKHLSERRYSRIQRSFSLPRSVDGSDIDASMSDGVLSVVLKKTEASKPRRVEIREAQSSGSGS